MAVATATTADGNLRRGLYGYSAYGLRRYFQRNYLLGDNETTYSSTYLPRAMLAPAVPLSQIFDSVVKVLPVLDLLDPASMLRACV